MPQGAELSATTRSSWRKIHHPYASLDHCTGEFVTEKRGRQDHPRVISATEDFEVGAAGQSGADPNDEFAGRGLRNGDVLDADVLAAVKDRGLHRTASIEKRMLDSPATKSNT